MNLAIDAYFHACRTEPATPSLADVRQALYPPHAWDEPDAPCPDAIFLAGKHLLPGLLRAATGVQAERLDALDNALHTLWLAMHLGLPYEVRFAEAVELLELAEGGAA